MPTANPAPLAPASKADFSGLWIPLVTPLTGDDRALDPVALRRLLGHYRSAGIAGYVVCGSTGEAASLGTEEQWQVLETVLEHAAGLPVAAPHYIRPSQDGLLHWFESVASAASKPVILYDIPYRTGVEITLPNLQRLGQHPNICAIKDCGGDAAKTQQLIADGGLQVLAGEDVHIFGSVAAGASGAISASARWRKPGCWRTDCAGRCKGPEMPLPCGCWQRLKRTSRRSPAEKMLLRSPRSGRRIRHSSPG